MQRGTNRLPWHKRLAFNLVIIAGAWAIIELASLTALVMHNGSLEVHIRRRHAAANQEPDKPGGARLIAPTMLHPYIGAVEQPADDGGVLSIAGKYRITEYGFADEGVPIHKRSANRVIIGIVGGSVARQFSLNATESLAREFSTWPEFAGRTCLFVRLAGNGYKQPQQLMIINYMLSLGAEFDILINLDGLNEVALPRIDNIPFGVNSSYPRDWAKMTAGFASSDYVRIVGHITFLRHQQRDAAKLAESVPRAYSPTAQLIWSFQADRLEQEILGRLNAISSLAPHELTYSSSGPAEDFHSADEIDTHCIDLWRRSSIVVHGVCVANDIRYFHFLQPNQYLPGSKPIGSHEASVAIAKDNPMGASVQACFPLMRTESARRLTEAGVAFTDLTDVFADHPEQIYNDFCCHVEKEGDLIMAKAIAAQIKQFIAQNPMFGSPE